MKSDVTEISHAAEVVKTHVTQCINYLYCLRTEHYTINSSGPRFQIPKNGNIETISF